MPNREDVLEEKTFKDQCDTLSQRVYYTLATSDPKLKPATNEKMHLHRNSLAIANLFEHLQKKGLLSSKAVDDILLNVALS